MRKILMTSGIAMLVASAFLGESLAEVLPVEAEVRQQVLEDLEKGWTTDLQTLEGRTCLDGRPVKGFEGDVAEYWVDLECSYCGVVEPDQAQRSMPNLCIVVRHAATAGESVKKALSYEALKHFSAAAANRFWDAVHPRQGSLPAPHQESLIAALREAAIDPQAFTEILQKKSTAHVDADMTAAGQILSTPTYVLSGIRFNSCDFTASQLTKALSLAKKVRTGDIKAREKIISVITKGRMNEDFSL